MELIIRNRKGNQFKNIIFDFTGHTFAITITLLNEVSISIISRTQIYAKVIDENK